MNGIKAGLELQKIAVSMGKIYKTLSVLSGKIQDGADVLNNKEDFYVLAYTCRVALLDRIQANDWIQMEIFITSKRSYKSISYSMILNKSYQPI